MKAANYRNIVLIVLLVPVISCFGQTDSTLIKEKEQDFVNVKFKERASMFYIGGNTTIEGLNNYFGATNGIYTAYEHKFHKYHVIGAGMGYYFHYFKYYFYDGYDPLLCFDLSYKYFHNLNSRMRRGLTGNNFSANYFYVSPNFSFLNHTSSFSTYAWDFTNGYWVATSTKEILCRPALKLGYGFQRVIQDKMNIDINAGIQINKYTEWLYPQQLFFLQLKLGFIIK
jgi:hypothetical protein